MGNLIDLNDRIFAAMDELDQARGKPEQGDAIELARAKADLFGLAIKNASVINQAAKMQEQAIDGLAMQVGVSRLLLGQPQIAANAERQALPQAPSEAVDWVRGNGAGHSVAWMCTKLEERFGRDFQPDEVRVLCKEADVVPVELGTYDIREADGKRIAARRARRDG